ncbi:MAG: tetratricopeptide repeat protein [Mariniphaga sp.]|nr:tetratricopeptide repeat protein [Mariniphaga sp.]
MLLLPWLEKIPDLHSSRKHKKLLLYPAVVVLIIVLILIGSKIGKKELPIESEQINNSEWQNSIAVLPFLDLSPEKDQEYFCDGMTEQILTNLARLNKLKVIARTSVMKFKDTQKTIPEIGKELNVQNILEGSIRKFGNRLRVTVQLVKAEDGSHIWAEDYDGEYTDLFTIQDEISKAIADTLFEKLSANEVDVIKSNQVVNLQAYEYYLKGEYLHRNKFWSSSSFEDFKDSEQMFLKAIELDSLYAPSYAGLVDLYNTYWNTQVLDEEERQKYLNLQEKYISIAYNLDPESADVNRVIGWVYSARNEIDKKIEYIKKAVILDGNDPENIRALGIFYDNIGLKNLAAKFYDRCLKLDPYDAKYYYYLANIYFHLGQFQKAKSEFQKALVLEPNDARFLLRYTLLLFHMKEFKEMEVLCSKYNQLYPNTADNRFLNAVLFVKNGEKEKALNVDMHSENKMLIYLYLKMSEEALQSMENYSERTKESERSNYIDLKNNPVFEFLRSDSRFQEMLAKHKILYDENLLKYGDIDI